MRTTTVAFNQFWRKKYSHYVSIKGIRASELKPFIMDSYKTGRADAKEELKEILGRCSTAAEFDNAIHKFLHTR